MLAGLLASPARASCSIERVSVSTSGEQADKDCVQPSISADGRFVAFLSYAENLVPGDTNQANDAFVHDRLLGISERVNVSSNGEQGNCAGIGNAFSPAISGDGRFVAFDSCASNLVTGDTNGTTDVFVRDRLLGMTERVSVSSTGGQADNSSGEASITPDGRFVAFTSSAANLVAGDTNGRQDVFVRDRVLRTTERVSLTSAGEQLIGSSRAPAISVDGRFVAFLSNSANLPGGGLFLRPQIYVRDRVLGKTEAVSVTFDGWPNDNSSSEPCITPDGRFVAFGSSGSNLVPEDSNGAGDVFVRDRLSGTTELVSVNDMGDQGNKSSNRPSISADGRFVLFLSDTDNLVAGDTNGVTDVFVRDRLTRTTLRVNVSTSGEQANAASDSGGGRPVISPDGNFVAFTSGASNLVPGDTNGVTDIFIWECLSSFADVHCYDWAGDYVEAMAAAGVTRGCAADPPRFCPDRTLTRLQMAVFLARAIGGVEGYTPAACGQERFGDVPCDYLTPEFAPSDFYTAVEYIADAEGNSLGRAISRGCGFGTMFCPEQTVSRAQMALFIARAIGGLESYVAAPCGQERFRDVRCPHVGGLLPGTETYRAIEYLADGEHNPLGRAIIRGCGDGAIFCPTSVCTRAEMAAFLARAFLGVE
jgi:Tol biopolymer transport system component